MPLYRFLWTDRARRKIAAHDITEDEVEHVMQHPAISGTSRSSGLPTASGYTPSGRWIFCVYEDIDGFDVAPVTAYEEEP